MVGTYSSIAEGLDLIDDFSSVASVHDQYSDALYSSFVQSKANQWLYEEYFHFEFLQRIGEALEVRLREGGQNADVSVLDLGCGNGVLSRKIKALFPKVRVVGVDQSEAMLSEARRLTSPNCGIEFSGPHDISSLPDIGLFDVAISGFVLCHASSKEQLRTWFEQIAGHLKPGGLMLHVVPKPSGDFKVPDGAVERVRLPFAPDGAEDVGKASLFVELFNYHWRGASFLSLTEAAGFVHTRCWSPEPSPQGALLLEKERLLTGRWPEYIRLLAAWKPA